MAVTVVATAGDASANSYVTLAEFTTYMDGRSVSAAFDDASDDAKNRALVSAARRLDAERFKGVRVDETQALQWPRYGVEKPDIAYSVLDGPVFTESTWYATTEIPDRIQRAQMEIAYLLLSTEFAVGPTGLEGFKNVKVGALDVTPRSEQRAGTLPEVAYREIAPLLLRSRGSFAIVRG